MGFDGNQPMPYLGSSEFGYSLPVQSLGQHVCLVFAGAGLSRRALPLRFSVIFEYGGLIP